MFYQCKSPRFTCTSLAPVLHNFRTHRAAAFFKSLCGYHCFMHGLLCGTRAVYRRVHAWCTEGYMRGVPKGTRMMYRTTYATRSLQLMPGEYRNKRQVRGKKHACIVQDQCMTSARVMHLVTPYDSARYEVSASSACKTFKNSCTDTVLRLSTLPVALFATTFLCSNRYTSISENYAPVFSHRTSAWRPSLRVVAKR